MFNLFPKKKSVDDILEDNGLSPLPYTNVVTFTVDGKVYTAEEFIKHYKDLYTENENNKSLLKSIEEDGTKEHNEAVKLRQENAQLKVEIDSLKNSIMVWRTQYDQEVAKNTKLEDEIIEYKKGNKNWANLYQEVVDKNNELLKEVNGLRHLKKENVELIEKLLKKEGNNYGITFNEAKTQIIQNDYKKCAEERNEYKHQLNAANKENKALKNDKEYWKEQFDEVTELLHTLKKEYEERLKELNNSVVDVNRENKEFCKTVEALENKLRDYQDKYAKSFSYEDENKALKKEKAILERWKYEQLIVNEMWNRVDSYVRDHDDAPLGGFVANTCLNFLKERDELKKRVDGLSLTIDRKNFEIDDLKAEIKKLKEDIVDYVIEKDDKLDEAKETIDVLKNMKAQGFEDYDPRDFEKDDELKKTQDWNRLVHGIETEKIYVCNQLKR